MYAYYCPSHTCQINDLKTQIAKKIKNNGSIIVVKNKFGILNCIWFQVTSSVNESKWKTSPLCGEKF